VGIDAFELLTKLGYEVILDHEESGRAYISKGFLEEAKAIANTSIFTPIISQEVALMVLNHRQY
jgi:Fe-S oxidoreductase